MGEGGEGEAPVVDDRDHTFQFGLELGGQLGGEPLVERNVGIGRAQCVSQIPLHLAGVALRHDARHLLAWRVDDLHLNASFRSERLGEEGPRRLREASAPPADDQRSFCTRLLRCPRAMRREGWPGARGNPRRSPHPNDVAPRVPGPIDASPHDLLLRASRYDGVLLVQRQHRRPEPF
jgi:hypothetical protein